MQHKHSTILPETMRLIKKVNNVIHFLQSQKYSYAKDLSFIDCQIQKLKEWIQLLIQNTNPEKIEDFINQNLFEIEHYQRARPSIIPLLEKVSDILNENDDLEITHAKFIAPPKQVFRKDLEWIDLGDKYKICFRGDSQDPKNKIFKSGIIPRGEAYVDGFDLDPLIQEPFESLPMVTAFSSRFLSACCFPFDLQYDNDTWVYIFKISKFVDVHAHGIKTFVEQSNNGISLVNIPEDDLGSMFTDELITINIIPPEDIIGAVRVKRFAYDSSKHAIPNYLQKSPADFTASDKYFIEVFQQRGRFELGQFIINPKCNLPQSEINVVKTFIRNEMRANLDIEQQGANLPLPPSGYHANSFLQELKVRHAAQSKQKVSNERPTYKA